MQKFTGRSALVHGDRRGLLDRIQAASGERGAKHRDGRGARRSRREEGEYREYSTDEQRRAPGCIARRMPRTFLHRLLDTPHLAQVVPRLPPDVLHRVIERCGLEDCGEIVALATPAQVARVLDLDLWRSPSAGLDEQFDAERFGVWIEVLVEQGADVAARTVAGLDTDLVAAGLAQHARIFHIATLDGYVTTDGTDIPAVIEPDGGLACEIAGNRIIARRPDAWDAIVEVLAELDASHPAAFARIMRACRALSNSRSELDGLDALLSGADQAMFDLADEREQRREARGFASPAQARAFLESSRRLRLGAAAAPDTAIPRTTRPNPAASDPRPSDSATAAVIDLLADAGLVASPPRGSLDAARQEELAALANVLVAGCTIDGRAFTPQEASDAVLATCSLGLECWPARWRDGGTLSDDLLVEHDLLTVFQVGWTVLHDDVCVPTVSRLLDVLAGLPAHDAETQAGLDALRWELTRHWRAGTAWQARDALDVLATLDLPAWTTLLGLIAECPVVAATIDAGRPGGPRRVDPSAFTFIARRAQIDAVAAFLDTLPDALRG
jgi:hypothetical protein